MSYQNIVLFVWTCQPAQHSNIYILHNLYLIVISKLCFLCLNILTEQHWSVFEEGLAIFQPIADGRVFRLLLFFLVRLVPQKYIYIIFKMNLHTKMLPMKSATQVATQPLLDFHSVKHKSFRDRQRRPCRRCQNDCVSVLLPAKHTHLYLLDTRVLTTTLWVCTCLTNALSIWLCLQPVYK